MSATEKAQVFLLLGVAAILAFGGSVFNGFVWDDHLVIVQNHFVQEPANLGRLFSPSYLTQPAEFKDLGLKDIGSGEVTYRPVTTLSYFILYALFGLDPAGYHFANLMLHILNACLIFLFCLRLGLGRAGAVFAGVLFAVHGVAAESVHGISYNENLLCLVFLLAGMLEYSAPGVLNRRRTVKTAIWFLLSAFSKETGIIFFPLILLYDFFIRGRAPSFSKENRLFLLATAFFVGVRFFLMRIPETWMFVQNGSLWTIPKAAALAWAWLFFPGLVHLTLPQDPSLLAVGPSEPAVLLSTIFLALSLFLAWRLRGSFRTFSFGAGFVFLALIPTLPLLMSNLSSRYLYVGLAGFCILAGGLFDRLVIFCRIFLRKGVWLLVLVPVLYALPSFGTERAWRDDLIFFKEVAFQNPLIALAHSELALRLKRVGKYPEAIKEYEIALSLDPTWTSDRIAMAECLIQSGRLEEAAVQLESVLQKDSRSAEGWLIFGVARGLQSRHSEAMAAFQKSLEIEPSFSAWNGLAVVYANLGMKNEADEALTKALALQPQNGVAERNRRLLRKA